MEVFVPKPVGDQVHQLESQYPVITCSDKHIIMMSTDDWNKVIKWISDVSDLDSPTFIDGLWGTCFWIVWNEEKDCSFWSIYDEHVFVLMCQQLRVCPILLPVSFSIPQCFQHNEFCVEESYHCDVSIDLIE